jgi:hypothetical protein
LDKKRIKLKREELSGARRSKYRYGALAAKRPRPGRWDSATTIQHSDGSRRQRWQPPTEMAVADRDDNGRQRMAEYLRI